MFNIRKFATAQDFLNRAKRAVEARLRAAFAVMYAHKKANIIPDMIGGFGRADDSSIVRAVLIQNELAFAKYAASQHLNWAQITSKP